MGTIERHIAASGFARRACPLCASEHGQDIIRLRAAAYARQNDTYRSDFAALLAISPDTIFPIRRCSECGFVFAAYALPQEFLSAVYERIIDPIAAKPQSTNFDRIALHQRLGSLVCAELSAMGASRSENVLDYGTGFGDFVRALRAYGIESFGFEPSAVRTASGDPYIFTTEDAAQAHGPYSAIVMTDVIEHVERPKALLAALRDWLTPNGFLVILVPSFPAQRIKALQVLLATNPDAPFSRELNPWEHLNYFSAADLRRMLTQTGFEAQVPLEPVDIGLRPRLSGIARLGNGAKSMLRAARHVLGGTSEATLLIARRPCGEPP
jgi:2-polyprenyl-3-methyl-5-hydroxy-6-metoxy-1,4-benzoquinol methylase